MLRNLTIVVGLTIGSLSLANQSAHALSWNWSVGGNYTGIGVLLFLGLRKLKKKRA